jgi:hypothetical protein
MLQRTAGRHGPVFCQIVDRARLGEMSGGTVAAKGRAFNTRIELGDGVEQMGTEAFRERVDATLKPYSQMYQTAKGCKITNTYGEEVQTLFSYEKYIISGRMAGGYIKMDQKYGPRLTGFGGAKYKDGLKNAAQKD